MMLKIEHVSKKFKNKEVLKDINFSIEKGELIYMEKMEVESLHY